MKIKTNQHRNLRFEASHRFLHEHTIDEFANCRFPIVDANQIILGRLTGFGPDADSLAGNSAEMLLQIGETPVRWECGGCRGGGCHRWLLSFVDLPLLSHADPPAARCGFWNRLIRASVSLSVIHHSPTSPLTAGRLFLPRKTSITRKNEEDRRRCHRLRRHKVYGGSRCLGLSRHSEKPRERGSIIGRRTLSPALKDGPITTRHATFPLVPFMV